MNPANDPDATEPQIHRGHTPEDGLLARVREWTDVFPWLRLVRTLRVAGSPPLVSLVAVTFAVWWLGQAQLFGSSNVIAQLPVTDTRWFSFTTQSGQLNAICIGFLRQIQPTSLFHFDKSWWYTLIMITWSIVIWSPAILMLTRQGALLTAGRPMTGFMFGCKASLRRTPVAWLTAIVPLACVLAIGLMIVIIGWVSRLFAGMTWIEFGLGVIAALIAIPCGLLAFGANFAIPLGWAALANERNADALDSLSRGYEYLLRRPLRLAFYLLVSYVALLIVSILASGIAHAGMITSAEFLAASGSPPRVAETVEQLLRFFPVIVVLTLFWSLVGGVYLLLRCDAGGQEVEDLWQPDPEPKPSLPQLPTSAESNA